LLFTSQPALTGAMVLNRTILSKRRTRAGVVALLERGRWQAAFDLLDHTAGLEEFARLATGLELSAARLAAILRPVLRHQASGTQAFG